MLKNSGVTFSSLDPSQKEAFRTINNSSTNLHIVQGPPGTGKSQLIVSLLERLASEDKKVLFVSQNTEALHVIERMIKRTEKIIGYPSDNKYVSLLDFCLMLHNPTHRQLKYLREQYTRVSNKQLPVEMRLNTTENITYDLRYTNLDNTTNYTISGNVIGFDELVSYYLRYVTHPMAPEPLRMFENVDVRTIFKSLDSYRQRDYFSEFNKPRRELVLLSSSNPNLSLPNVRGALKDIQDATKGNWTHYFAAKSPLSIIDYLSTLKEYVSARQIFDIYKLATEEINLTELHSLLNQFGAENQKVTDSINQLDAELEATKQQVPTSIQGVSHDSPILSFNDAVKREIEKDIDLVTNELKRIIQLAQELLKTYPDITHIGIKDIWIGLAKHIAQIYNDVIGDTNSFVANLTLETIDQLEKDIANYDSLNAVKRLMNGTPVSFKDYLGLEGPKGLDVYRSGVQETIVALRNAVGAGRIADLLEIAAQTPRVPLSRIGIQPSKQLQAAVDAFTPMNELFQLLTKYDIDTVNFDTTKIQLRDISSDITALRSAITNDANKKIYLNTTLSEFMVLFNTSVKRSQNRYKHQSLLEHRKTLQNNSFRQISPYLVNITDVSGFTTRSDEIIEYLAHKIPSLKTLITTIALPDDNMPIEENLDVIQDTIQRATSSDNFSEYFFEIDKGKTIADWLASVSSLDTYNNDAEVVEFVEHNKAINTIQAALGVENKKYLENVLANDINFDVFSARIVSAIVNECFGRAKMTQKKHITTADIIKSYETYLKAEKVQTYRTDLQHIHSQSVAATKELSKQSTLQASGRSTMDKFRHNTKLILDAFPIVCATPKEVSKYIAPDKAIFDYVIFDEASQLLPGQAIPSMYRAEKAVIIGDPHQMPPSLNAAFGLIEQSEDDFDDLGESILDLALKQPQQKHHLKVHYRSKYNKLFEPSREAIYSQDGIEPIFEAELANGAPIDIVDDLGENIDEHGYDKNFYKICESISNYLEQDSKADFCVLFTTGKVLLEFKNFIAEVGEKTFPGISKLYGEDKILMSTVTNCQGIEGTFTIIYMHHYSNPGMMWFFKEAAGAYKRLNVSITRQREGLTLLLADPRSHWLKACDDKLRRNDIGQNTYKSAELMKALLTNAGEQADTTYLDRKLTRNATYFDSPLNEQLFNKLSEHYGEKLGSDLKIYSEVGWNLLIPTGEAIGANERNVGFRIDIGIYSISKKKFVLGIEMDGAMYHSGYDKEHSDYTRQKVLEDKGWELYRIWSTNWLNDESREFSKLTEIIDNRLVKA